MKKYFDQIEDYLARKLAGDEFEDFERELKENAKLRHAVENFPIVVELLETLEENEMREYLKTLDPIKSKPKARIVPMKWYRIATAAVFLILIGCGYANLEYSDQKLIKSAYNKQTDWPSTDTRGDNVTNTLSVVNHLRMEDNLSGAIDSLQNPQGEKEYQALALLYFENGSYQLSLDVLNAMPDESEIFIKYYRSLNYLKLGDEQLAIRELEQLIALETYPKAENLLKRLKSPWRKLVF